MNLRLSKFMHSRNMTEWSLVLISSACTHLKILDIHCYQPKSWHFVNQSPLSQKFLSTYKPCFLTLLDIFSMCSLLAFGSNHRSSSPESKVNPLVYGLLAIQSLSIKPMKKSRKKSSSGTFDRMMHTRWSAKLFNL